VPRFHYELLVCGLRGHELLGTDAAELRPEDAVFARDAGDDVRWHRCLRCDSWVPLPKPDRAARRFPPAREDVELPLRGKPLRDKVVLRVIAVDRALHFLVLGIAAAAVLLFAAKEAQLRGPAYRVLAAVQGALGGPTRGGHQGLIDELRHLFAIEHARLTEVGLVIAAYAALEGAEAVGLWFQQRWAEYLTFVATTALIPLEIYELTRHVSPFKIIALIVNAAIVVYLLLAKRLFGLRGGGRAEEAAREGEVGWDMLERTAPAGAP
jgi:uncharacterized membrane protein (DUF2068 family)